MPRQRGTSTWAELQENCTPPQVSPMTTAQVDPLIRVFPLHRDSHNTFTKRDAQGNTYIQSKRATTSRRLPEDGLRRRRKNSMMTIIKPQAGMFKSVAS